jgi:Caspase domain
MKRIALLIGNTTNLQGVKVDLAKFRNFLLSNSGGAWIESEITTLQNPSRVGLLQTIQQIKTNKFNYAVVFFSGHGAHARRTVLEINQSGDLVEDKELHGIAPRQLSIHDCCRSQLVSFTESAALGASTFSTRSASSYIRQKYEARIMQAVEQQANLYSCSIGQVAYETSQGGIYTSNLLQSAHQIDHSQDFKTVGAAHQDSIEPTKRQSKAIDGKEQTPVAELARCLTSQQLIVSIRA